ncbi:MAG: methyltransferase domain-containing protein [Myxococcaceae bacterium]|nr:methyltransferase domain-containing protein [Myxococcaceae bacterium]
MNIPLELRGAVPRWVAHSALALRRKLHRLGDALVPAEVAVFDESAGALRTQVYRAAAELGLPDCVADAPRTARQLSDATGMEPQVLERFLRATVALGLFEKTKDGRFAATARSKALQKDGPVSLRDWVLYFGSQATQTAWLELGKSLRDDAMSPFRRVHQGTVWDHFARHPDEGEVFADAMGTMTALDAPGIARTYPFSRFNTVCDVGGGRGTLLAEIVSHHASVQGVLFDTAPVLEKAKAFLTQRGVVERVARIEGNFFETAPEGCDAYLLKDVLHDWDDTSCVKLLSTLRQHMKPGATLILIEVLLEEDLYSPVADLMMMVVTDKGRKRTLAELHQLLARAGFYHTGAVKSPTFHTLVEAQQ